MKAARHIAQKLMQSAKKRKRYASWIAYRGQSRAFRAIQPQIAMPKTEQSDETERVRHWRHLRDAANYITKPHVLALLPAITGNHGLKVAFDRASAQST